MYIIIIVIKCFTLLVYSLLTIHFEAINKKKKLLGQDKLKNK